MDATACAAFFALWPVGKMPVLRDGNVDRMVPETTIILEYLDMCYPGARRLFPDDAELRLEARLWDRFFDLHVQTPIQKIVGDKLRTAGKQDPRGVQEARKAGRRTSPQWEPFWRAGAALRVGVSRGSPSPRSRTARRCDK